MSRVLRLLDPTYEAIAQRVQERLGGELQALASQVGGTNPQPLPIQVYHILPWLFHDAFPSLSEEQLECIAAAGLLYFSHVIILDQAVDGDRLPPPGELLFASRMHERALTLLFAILPQTTEAWEHLSRYVRSYVEAVLLEASRASSEAYPLEVFEKVARGKSAILKGTPLMMASVSQRLDCLPALEAALDAFAVAVQIHDDLRDWRDDFRSGRQSYVLTRALQAATCTRAGSDDLRSEEMVGHYLFHSDVAIDALALANAACDHSRAAASAVGADRWSDFVAHYQRQLEELVAGFQGVRSRAQQVAQHPRGAESGAAALTRCSAWLAHEHARGYPEAQHVMKFPAEDGFTGEQEVHGGDVFQRALLGTVLPDLARDHGLPQRLIEENFHTILSRRRPSERSGWAYFPTLPELPPDTDDLAQVIQSWLAGGSSGEERFFRTAVEVALEYARGADGSIGTWILDPGTSPERLERYRWGVTRHWGRGADPEVGASFWYSLHRWDAECFGKDIRSGAEHVAQHQSSEGYWESTWYVGPHYGTFVATRLLAAISPDHPALERACSWLEHTQRSDGGWGGKRMSSPLQTALGLLSCLACQAAGRESRAATPERALRYLLVAQSEAGFWSSSPFIRMDLNRAVGQRARYLEYGSATVTSAFAAQALISARRLGLSCA